MCAEKSADMLARSQALNAAEKALRSILGENMPLTVTRVAVRVVMALVVRDSLFRRIPGGDRLNFTALTYDALTGRGVQLSVLFTLMMWTGRLDT